MDDLVQFLRARLLEDERAATDTLSPALQVGRLRGKPVLRWRITESDRGLIDEDGGILRARDIFPAEAAHAVRHDPARVLAEVEAKRRMLEALLGEGHAALRPGGSTEIYCGADYGAGDPCDCGRDERISRFLRLLALPYADHPDYREEWRP